MNSSASLAKTYQKKTDKQHVLDNPDTYTGSMTKTEYDTYVFDADTNTIKPKQIHYYSRTIQAVRRGYCEQSRSLRSDVSGDGGL